ncbi:MAG: electron transfer flavoprotein subunit alpha/FixB family protein [Microthrixaceae bacterium]|nr:electron transfer flavoprotein subunit alpha/FixB family protein [Microthrixaceae bacterium]
MHGPAVPVRPVRSLGVSANPATPRPVAVVVIREGVLPPGADETVAEAAGRTILVGSVLGPAAGELAGICARAELAELDPGAGPGAIAEALAPALRSAPYVVLPASPDGRDLAPRLAAKLGRPLYANATEVSAEKVTVLTQGGRVQQTIAAEGHFVATLQPGVRGVIRTPGAEVVLTAALPLEVSDEVHDAEVLEVLPPDPATVHLAEAERLVGGGAGLLHDPDEGPDVQVRRLAAVGEALGAAMGATRVVTDAGWVGHDRQIGTTGVVVDPALYLAFGISGAVQHTAGLGHPDHIISINTDPHCPMMAMADLAVVADAPGVLAELAARLGR